MDKSLFLDSSFRFCLFAFFLELITNELTRGLVIKRAKVFNLFTSKLSSLPVDKTLENFLISSAKMIVF